MSDIPALFEGSRALDFIKTRGWEWKVSNAPNVELESCPYCNKSGGGHFYIEIHGAADDQQNRDGLHACHKCGKGGSLYTLKQHLGVATSNSSYSGYSRDGHEFASAEKKKEALPDIETCHQALLEDEPAMDYLMNGRGFTRDIIERMKIGLVPKRYFRECGEVRALLYPYLVNGQCVFVHYRTLPKMPLATNKVPKAFSSPTGWDATLYNGEALNRPGLKDITFVEGEPNTIAALDHGYEDICGVPGANFKKADWIDTLDRLELERHYICYDSDNTGQKAARNLAARVGVERCWRIMLPDFDFVDPETGETKKGKDLNEWYRYGGGTPEAFNKLKEEAVMFDVDGVSSTKDAVTEFREQILGNGIEPKYRPKWPSLAKLVGFDEGDVIDIIAPEKIGKAQSLDSLIKTPTGWVRMGDVQVGDQLASIDGEENRVTGVFPQGVMQLFEVEFQDGRKTLATSDHLWFVGNKHDPKKPGRVVRTAELTEDMFIPRPTGHYGSKATLPIDPWFMGALLGNGNFSETIGYTTIDHETAERIYNLIKPLGMHVNKYATKGSEAASYRLCYKRGHRNPLVDVCRTLGLMGADSYTKFIPAVYLNSDRSSRWKLLQGLMDTDGTISNWSGAKSGSLTYSTSSKQLARDVQYLVRSLGGMCRIGTKKSPIYTYKGQKRIGAVNYVLGIRFDEAAEVFSIERKRNLFVGRKNMARLRVKAVRPATTEEAQCIAVSHPSKLYITDDFIVTHNTTFGLNLMEDMVDRYGDDGIIICLEMMTAKLARKWVSHVAQVADNIPKTPEEAALLKTAFLNGIDESMHRDANRPGKLYFCYPHYKTVDDIYKLMIDCIRRYGVKWIMLDNLQRLADTTPAASRNRTIHLSEISKKITQIGKDYKVQMVRIVQPHRVMSGKIVSTDNVDGASQIEKDCDHAITLHRNRIGELSANDFESLPYVESDMTFDEKMLVTLGLTRYQAGGYTTLQYDGARSTVNEYNIAQIAKIKAEALKHVGYNGQLAQLGAAVAPKEETPTVPQPGDITI